MNSEQAVFVYKEHQMIPSEDSDFADFSDLEAELEEAVSPPVPESDPADFISAPEELEPAPVPKAKPAAAAEPKKPKGPRPGHVHVDRDGNRISAKQWVDLQADPTYVNVRSYANDKIRAELRWTGAVRDGRMVDQMYSDSWELYSLTIENRLDVTDPDDDSIVLSSTWVPSIEGKLTFPDEEKALEAYTRFLVKWTASKMLEQDDGSTVLDEIDNVYTPKEPEPLAPGPDVMAVNDAIKEDFGSW